MQVTRHLVKDTRHGPPTVGFSSANAIRLGVSPRRGKPPTRKKQTAGPGFRATPDRQFGLEVTRWGMEFGAAEEKGLEI